MDKLSNEKKHEKITVVDVKHLDNYTKSITFSKPKHLEWEAGANGHFAFKDYDLDGLVDKTLVRHMSFATLPESGQIIINSRVPGSHSIYKQKLNALTIGDEMYLYGTKNRMPLIRENTHIVLISMGIGITSFKTFLDEYKKDSTNIKSMKSLCVDGHLTYLYKGEYLGTIESTYCHNQKTFYNLLESLIDTNQSFYIVGSDQFLIDVIKKLRESGINKNKIYVDKKPNKFNYLGLE